MIKIRAFRQGASFGMKLGDFGVEHLPVDRDASIAATAILRF